MRPAARQASKAVKQERVAIMQVRSTVLAFHYDLQKQCPYRH
jgi:hypothetical protein